MLRGLTFWKLFMAMVLVRNIVCQYEKIQSIKNSDEYDLFGVSTDFRFMAVHSNHNNTLHIYEL